MEKQIAPETIGKKASKQDAAAVVATPETVEEKKRRAPRKPAGTSRGTRKTPATEAPYRIVLACSYSVEDDGDHG